MRPTEMSTKKVNVKALDTIAEETLAEDKYPFWGSARMVYTVCAFLAMVVHLCMRNTINFVILCMVKFDPATSGLNQSIEQTEHYSNCYTVDNDANSSVAIKRVGWFMQNINVNFYMSYIL